VGDGGETVGAGFLDGCVGREVVGVLTLVRRDSVADGCGVIPTICTQ